MREYDNPYSQLIADFIQSRAALKLAPLDKARDKALAALVPDSSEYLNAQTEHQTLRQKELAKFLPAVWLDSAAGRAKQISVVHFAPKYTHSDAKGNGILVGDTGKNQALLTSEALSRLDVDIVGNAAFLDVGALLLKQVKDKALYQVIADNDATPFLPFAESEQQATTWLCGFQQALTPSELASHRLAKQVYFPLSDGGYHLLLPLFASSLYHQLHAKFEYAFYSDEQKAAREARKHNKTSEVGTVSYPGLATLNFGGTKPQNISQLNTRRNGQAHLLSCAPPTWQQQPMSTETKRNFWHVFSRRAGRKAAILKSWLKSVEHRHSTKVYRDYRARLLEELIDLFIATAAEIQNMTEDVGWSIDSELSDAEQLWLDPYRPDEAFQLRRQTTDWQTDIAHRFATWLNERLQGNKGMDVGDNELNEWRRQLERALLTLELDLLELEGGHYGTSKEKSEQVSKINRGQRQGE